MNEDLIYFGITAWTAFVFIYDALLIYQKQIEIYCKKSYCIELLLDCIGIHNLIISKLVLGLLVLSFLLIVKKFHRRGPQYKHIIRNTVFCILMIQTVLFMYIVLHG